MILDAELDDSDVTAAVGIKEVSPSYPEDSEAEGIGIKVVESDSLIVVLEEDVPTEGP